MAPHKYFYIFDDAQATYGDYALWDLCFKRNVQDCVHGHFALFVGHGSPNRAPTGITPFVIPEAKRVGLRPLSSQAHGVGLSLTVPEEIASFLECQLAPGPKRFTDEFLEGLVHMTSGHVGALEAAIRVLKEHPVSHERLIFLATTHVIKSYRRLANHELYTQTMFEEHVDVDKFLSSLRHAQWFRGVPFEDDLRDIAYATVFRDVLLGQNLLVIDRDLDKRIKTHCQREAGGDQDLVTNVEAADECIRKGWLQLEPVRENRGVMLFPSALHKLYVQWKLVGPHPPPLSDDFPANIVHFSWKVISLFSQNRLLGPRMLSDGAVQRHQEADYQDEFSRCCYKFTSGRLKIFPEFGGPGGKVDFYVEDLGWGIELLRDGSDLSGHVARFRPGGKYPSQMSLVDYIVLDFREVAPIVKHPGWCPEIKCSILCAKPWGRASQSFPRYHDKGFGEANRDGSYDK
jgi:hypothetical protein